MLYCILYYDMLYVIILSFVPHHTMYVHNPFHSFPSMVLDSEFCLSSLYMPHNSHDLRLLETGVPGNV